MQLQAVTPSTSAVVADFLRRYDYMCATLTDYFIRQRSDTSFFVLYEQGTICGVFSYSTAGVVLFCLPYPRCYPAMRDVLISFFKGKTLFCLNGCEPAASFMLSVLQAASALQARELVTYYLMIRPYTQKSADKTILADGYSIRQCSIDDLDVLFPLEKGFQREEVWINGMSYDEVTGKKIFARVLKTYPVFAVERCKTVSSPSQFVAKAAINALGYTCGQIGGVYTAPALRRCGFSLCAVGASIAFLAQAHLHAVLFVKQKNVAAYALYKKLGFVQKNSYMIAYW